MAYTISEDRLGLQPIATTDTVQNHPLGTVVRAYDPTYGAGEFIYLQGIGSTVVGSIVTYDGAYVTTLAAVGGLKPRPVAIAMSANVASQYGWYQISGQAVCKKSCGMSITSAGGGVGVLTVGLLGNTGTSGKALHGAAAVAISSAVAGRTTCLVMLNRPHKGSSLV